MAKRRRLASQPQVADASDIVEESAPLFSGVRGLDPISIAVGLLGASIVYISYYPSDSVSVEKGDALWFAVLAICIAAIVGSAWLWFGTAASGSPREDEKPVDDRAGHRPRFSLVVASGMLEIVPWLLAGWMMIAAFGSSPPGNLRMATNEAWLWVSAAAIFTSSRQLMASLGLRQAVLVLLVACSVGLAVHGLHQYYVSLPQNRAQYRQDPERVLELAGVDAPAGSAERMVFENRLFDGGPTGTFALANSLAAVLLIGVILCIGVLRFQWRDLSVWRRVAWSIAAILIAGCLLAARSRSATLATLVGLTLIFIASSRMRGRNPKALLLGLGGVSLLGIIGASFLAWKGNREWFEQAPASLAFRFQYWRSTWQMALDRPLFGAGPGNFQSIYERYREASATEQIAEPHNLFFETLASGGFIGIGMLILLIVSGFIVITLGRTEGNHQSSAAGPTLLQDPRLTGDRDRWLWLGAILSLLMIWLIGWASRQTPDLHASSFVLPISVAAVLFLWPSIGQLASRDLDSILGIALVGISIHLMVAGGWTVPGVAMIVWLCAAMLTRTGTAADTNSRRKPIAAGFVVGCAVLVLAAIYVKSVRPVEDQNRLMAIASRAQSMGQIAKARVTLERAAQADPWSPDAVLWLADFYRWKLIAESDNAADRRRWESSLREAKSRAGDDPAVYRMIGAQQLHVYQRHGVSADLAAAADTFALAAGWSPSNQWMMAQMAVVAMARGDTNQARKLANRAVELSQLGGNIERAISRQQVYVARHLGQAAKRGPIRQRADELLPEPNSTE